jgi:uncharacterized membrane protein
VIVGTFRQALRKSLITGFVALLPALIFFWVVKWLFRLVGSFVLPISLMFGLRTRTERWLSYLIIAAGLFLILLLVGAIVRTRRGVMLKEQTEDWLKRNVFGYSFIKSIVGHLFGEKRFIFSEVAIVRLFNSTTLATAFITDRHSDGSYTVFAPTGPNPTTGLIYHMLPEDVYPLKSPIDEAIKSIIACGKGSQPLIEAYLRRIGRETTFDLRSVTTLVSRLLDIAPPGGAGMLAPPIFHHRPITRALLFLPDAMGVHIFNRRPDLLQPILEPAPVSHLVSAMFPPMTPVCFASMFTGLTPEAHGIRKYEKPVLACDSLFDALARAGKKVALVAVRNSSMEIIFRGRQIEYFPEDYDEQALERGLALIRENRHDVVVVYQQAYDDALHEYGVFSDQAFAAAEAHVAAFTKLTGECESAWRDHDRCYLFAPDHGAHDVNDHGNHGENRPEDMDVRHFWGIHDRG